MIKRVLEAKRGNGEIYLRYSYLKKSGDSCVIFSYIGCCDIMDDMIWYVGGIPPRKQQSQMSRFSRDPHTKDISILVGLQWTPGRQMWWQSPVAAVPFAAGPWDSSVVGHCEISPGSGEIHRSITPQLKRYPTEDCRQLKKDPTKKWVPLIYLTCKQRFVENSLGTILIQSPRFLDDWGSVANTSISSMGSQAGGWQLFRKGRRNSAPKRDSSIRWKDWICATCHGGKWLPNLGIFANTFGLEGPNHHTKLTSKLTVWHNSNVPNPVWRVWSALERLWTEILRIKMQLPKASASPPNVVASRMSWPKTSSLLTIR